MKVFYDQQTALTSRRRLYPVGEVCSYVSVCAHSGCISHFCAHTQTLFSEHNERILEPIKLHCDQPTTRNLNATPHARINFHNKMPICTCRVCVLFFLRILQVPYIHIFSSKKHACPLIILLCVLGDRPVDNYFIMSCHVVMMRHHTRRVVFIVTTYND